MIHYPGQPQLCYICGESSHLRSECPRRKFSFPVTVAGRKPLLSEVVGGMSTNVRNITDQSTNLIEDPVQQVNVKEQMTNRQVEMQTENSTTGLNNGDSHDTSPVRPEDEHITPSVPMQGTSSMNTTTEYYTELALQTHTEINDKNKGQQKDGEEQMMEDDAEATDSDIEMEKNMSENNISIPQRQLQQKIMEQPRDDSDGKKELPPNRDPRMNSKQRETDRQEQVTQHDTLEPKQKIMKKHTTRAVPYLVSGKFPTKPGGHTDSVSISHTQP